MSFRTFANTPADQFACAMWDEDSPPGSIRFLAMNGEDPHVILQQKGGFGEILITHPEDLRSLGRAIMDAADEWESGKLDIPVPTAKGGG